MLTAARLLRDRGHIVRVIADADRQEDVHVAGFTFSPWQRAPSYSDMGSASSLGDPSNTMEQRQFFDRVMFGPAAAYAVDTREEIDRMATDALLVHDMLPGAAIAAEAAGVPCAMLSPHVSFRPLPGVPPVGSGLASPHLPEERAEIEAAASRLSNFIDEWLPILNEARASQGLAPLDHVLDLYDQPARVLLAISSAFDFPADRLPKNVRYVGPLLDPPGWSGPWQAPWNSEQPRVLVSFSTTFQGQVEALQRVVNALGGMAVDAVVTTGPAIEPTALCAPANVTVLRSAPHDAVMREASLVVTHGGHGTVSRALIHGLPLLVMPMGRDQNDNASRVEARGVGLMVPPTASEAEIGRALTRLVVEPHFRLAAGLLGKIVAADADGSALVREMEAVAASKRFVPKPTRMRFGLQARR
jgi:MGT family glycosyltransferase